jgi:hypothetical protein
MRRSLLCLLALLVSCGASLLAQPKGVQQGKIKAIDLDKQTVTLTSGGKEYVLRLTAETRVAGVDKEGKERFKGLEAGQDVFFIVGKKDGQEVLVGIKRMVAGGDKIARVDTSKLKPLTEMGDQKYQGYEGGLYPGGRNERPAAHEKAGLELARKVQPLDAKGKPAADGKIVLLSVGMSNTSQASESFARLLRKEENINPRLVFVNGAQGGMTAQAIRNPEDKGSGRKYWTTVDERLEKAGVTPAQVQVIWIKQANARPTQGFPAYARALEADLARIVQVLPGRFPNVRLVYLSSRTYGGYANTPLNPEPYAFESGLSVKWLIEKQIQGDPALVYTDEKGARKAPWLSWGPYLWANGETPRKDGFSYRESDFGGDGTHPSPAGQEKVGRELLRFFLNDSTTRPWFVRAR